MAGWSSAYEDALLDHIFQLGESDQAAPTIYVALCTSAPTDALTGTTLQSGGTEVAVGTGGYARIACSGWDAASNRMVKNTAAITFATLTASIGTITHVAICSHLTAGDLICWVALESSRTYDTGSVPYFAAGLLKIEFATNYISTYLANELLDHVFGTGLWNGTPVITSTAVSNVDEASNELEFAAAHGIATGDAFALTTTDADLPNGLSVNTLYYATDTSTGGVFAITVYSDAALTTQVTFSDDGTGTHTVHAVTTTTRLTPSFVFVDGDVHVANNTIDDAVGDTLSNGVPLIMSSSGTLPAGLAENTIYYIRQGAGTVFTMHPDSEDAVDAAAADRTVDITAAAGTGVHFAFLAPRTFVSLYYTNPSDDDTGTELSGGGYARFEVHATGNSGQTTNGAAEWAAASAGVVTNTGAVWDGDFGSAPAAEATWTASATWAEINYIAVHDALTSGNLLVYMPSTNTPILANLDTFVIADGDIDISLD